MLQGKQDGLVLGAPRARAYSRVPKSRSFGTGFGTGVGTKHHAMQGGALHHAMQGGAHGVQILVGCWTRVGD